MQDWQGQYRGDVPTRRENVSFPSGGRTELIVYCPNLTLSPAEMWTGSLGFAYNGKILKTFSIPTFTRDGALAERRINHVVENVRAALLQHAGHSRWSQDNHLRLSRITTRGRIRSIADIPDDIDEPALRDIMNISSQYILCHKVEERGSETLADGRTELKLGIRRMENHQPLDEWHNIPYNAPMEQIAYFPAGTTNEAINSYTERVEAAVTRDFQFKYSNFTDLPQDPEAPQLVHRMGYNPYTFRNTLNTAMINAIREFPGGSCNHIPPHGSRQRPRQPRWARRHHAGNHRQTRRTLRAHPQRQISPSRH